jgi:predicted transcriptional regulator
MPCEPHKPEVEKSPRLGVHGMVRYRGRWEIILEVLEATGRGAKKTHIMQKANLNYLRASMLLEDLSSRGLIFKDGDADGGTLYKLTEKGKIALNSGRIWKMNLSKKVRPS